MEEAVKNKQYADAVDEEYYSERNPVGDDKIYTDMDNDNDGEVLGTRSGEDSAVLGAKRDLKKQILTRDVYRRPEMEWQYFGWFFNLTSALGAVGVSGNALGKFCKKKRSLKKNNLI